MKPPLPYFESPFFLFSEPADFIKALGDSIPHEEQVLIQTLIQNGLPPVTSRYTLSTMFGVNPGLIWSMENRTKRYYRTFSIPKGNGVRRIDAPKVALKLIQKWFAVQLGQLFTPRSHVFGFIRGRSHIQAATVHIGAKWTFSVDIRDFFPSTPEPLVRENLFRLGFPEEGATLMARLSCLNGALAQGSPTSPILSNICFESIDAELETLAQKYSIRVSRYADDIVFSGDDELPPELQDAVFALFESTPWVLADEKTELAKLPLRLKVHGLLVHGDKVRLTKGYRHRLRAYKHLLNKGSIREGELMKVIGHLKYGDYIERLYTD